MPSRGSSGALWVVIPTYNEAENLEPIVRAVLAQLEGLGERDRRVLVVDDDSPDGTGAIADRLASAFGEVEVLHRQGRRGLGRAYVAAFRRALAAGAALIAQMDADFSHDPADLPRLLAAADSADLVLGSRYVAGGGVTDWGWLRRAISRGGSAYARTMLGIGIRDLTGGFKVFRREVLEAIDLGSVTSRGYAFQVETTYRALSRGFRVVEVPIVFTERRRGASKMSGTIVLEAALRVPAMRARRRPRPSGSVTDPHHRPE